MFIEDFLDLDVLDEICNTMILTLIYYIVPLVVIFLFKVSLKWKVIENSIESS